MGVNFTRVYFFCMGLMSPLRVNGEWRVRIENETKFLVFMQNLLNFALNLNIVSSSKRHDLPVK